MTRVVVRVDVEQPLGCPSLDRNDMECHVVWGDERGAHRSRLGAIVVDGRCLGRWARWTLTQHGWIRRQLGTIHGEEDRGKQNHDACRNVEKASDPHGLCHSFHAALDNTLCVFAFPTTVMDDRYDRTPICVVVDLWAMMARNSDSIVLGAQIIE